MFNLIAKDILVQKKQLPLSFAYILLIVFAFQSVGKAMFAVSIVAFTYMMIMTSCAYEDKNKADILLNSLPLKRSSIVLAKYLSVLVFFLMGTVAYAILTLVISISGIPIKPNPLSLESFVGGFAGVSLLSGLFLPVFFKLGYIKSKIYNFILFFVFFFGVSALSEVLQKQEIAWMKDITHFIQTKSDALIAVLLLGVILVFLMISYNVAAWFYKQREF